MSSAIDSRISNNIMVFNGNGELFGCDVLRSNRGMGRVVGMVELPNESDKQFDEHKEAVEALRTATGELHG